MPVRILLFASYADALGRDVVELAVPTHGASVGELVRELATLPGGERLPSRPLVAVNERYADLDTRVRAGDELALIPPVSGG